MKISDLSPAELKKYNAQSQKRSRERKKARAEAKALANEIPKAGKYRMPEAQRKKLDAHSAQFMSAVQAELTRLSALDRYIIESVADVSFGLGNNFTQAVHDPEGILIGGHFPDAAASEAIEHVHRNPAILESPTFTDVYRQFIAAVSKWSKKNSQFVAPEFASDIRRELDGTYELPKTKVEPIPERLPEPQSPPPSIELMGTKLGEQLAGNYSMYLNSASNSGSNIPPEAQQYLNHGKLNRNRI